MKAADAARLVARAAIWGASFLFIRIAAPVIGPAATGFDAQWRRWWRYYLLIGALNSAAPFLLYGYSALELPVGLMAVLNATSRSAVRKAAVAGSRSRLRSARHSAMGSRAWCSNAGARNERARHGSRHAADGRGAAVAAGRDIAAGMAHA